MSVPPPLAQVDYMARLRHEMARPPFHSFLKPEALAADASGAVVIRLPYRAEFARTPDEAGYHGGVIAALIDLAGHAAIAIRTGHMVPTVDLRIDYLRAAPGVALLARTKILKLGRSFGRADIDIETEAGQHIAAGRGTYSTS